MWKWTFMLLTLSFANQRPAPMNLLVNPDAQFSLTSWQVYGDATVEEVGGNPIFVVRNQGSLRQIVDLPRNAAGRFVVMFGRGSSERINADGAITGLPNLYGLIDHADGVHILAHLQAPTMLARPLERSAWVKMWGVFQVPSGAARLWFYLQQAQRAGVPQDGSAARFDDLGLFLFDTKADAMAFVSGWLQDSSPNGRLQPTALGAPMKRRG